MLFTSFEVQNRKKAECVVILALEWLSEFKARLGY
jgi:hypothetical protein